MTGMENKYSLSFQSLVDHKIIDLQYRILHRYLGTNKLLFKIGRKSSPSCERCMFQIETIEHIFYECFAVKNFWLSIVDKYNEYFKVNVKISCKDVILMYKGNDETLAYILNTLLLYGKQYVYKCKMNNCTLHLDQFMKYMKNVMEALALVKCKDEDKYILFTNFISYCL